MKSEGHYISASSLIRTPGPDAFPSAAMVLDIGGRSVHAMPSNSDGIVRFVFTWTWPN